MHIYMQLKSEQDQSWWQEFWGRWTPADRSFFLFLMICINWKIIWTFHSLIDGGLVNWERYFPDGLNNHIIFPSRPRDRRLIMIMIINQRNTRWSKWWIWRNVCWGVRQDISHSMIVMMKHLLRSTTDPAHCGVMVRVGAEDQGNFHFNWTINIWSVIRNCDKTSNNFKT